MSAGFLNKLDVEKVNETTWKLIAPLQYQTNIHHIDFFKFTVPIYFETDFASVPRLCSNLGDFGKKLIKVN